MTDQDRFFTHTVVGQPISVELGRRMGKKELRSQGTPTALAINMATPVFDLPQVWKDWCLVQGAYPFIGSPRRRLGSTRRWLERHSLILAVVSIVLILTMLGVLALMLLSPQRFEALRAVVGAALYFSR